MKNKSLRLLISIGLTSSYALAAKAPTVVVSGSTSISIGASNQKITDGGKKNGSANIGIGLSDIYFTAAGENDSGLTYKWRSNITAIPGIVDIDRNYLEFGHDNYGTFQIGAVSGTEDTFAQNAFKLIGGAAGMDGAFGGFYNTSSGVIGGVHLLGYTKRANKVVYATPTVNGFQFGVAYTPNTSTAGRGGLSTNKPQTAAVGNDSALYPKDNAPFGLNNVALGLAYTNAWDDFSVNADITYVRENSRFSGNTIALNNASSYQLGVIFGYKNFRFGGSYTDNGKSRLPKAADQEYKINDNKKANTKNMNLGNAGKMWDLALQYKMDAYQFSVGYFSSKRNFDATGKTQSDTVTLTADYSALPGLKFFAEVDFTKSKTCQAAMAYANSIKDGSAVDNNSGQVFLIGTRISF
jgi:hypothetical protein